MTVWTIKRTAWHGALRAAVPAADTTETTKAAIGISYRGPLAKGYEPVFHQGG